MTEPKSIYEDGVLRNEIRLKAKNDDNKNLTEDQITLCIMAMEKYRVSYFHKHLWPNERNRDGSKVLIWALTADGQRAMARRHGLAGQDAPTWDYDDNGNLISATVTVYRRNSTATGPGGFEMYTGVAYYDEFVEKKYGGDVNAQWARRPRNQLAKCAEMQALSRGFPETMGETVLVDEGRPNPSLRSYEPATSVGEFVERFGPIPEPDEDHEDEGADRGAAEGVAQEPDSDMPDMPAEQDPSSGPASAPEGVKKPEEQRHETDGPAPAYEALPALRAEGLPFLKAYCEKHNGGVGMSWRAAFDVLCESTLTAADKMKEPHYEALIVALKKALQDG